MCGPTGRSVCVIPSCCKHRKAQKRKGKPDYYTDIMTYSVLAAVVQDGDIRELLKILYNREDAVDIDQKNHVGLTALHHGVLSNNLDTVKILLSHGAQVNVPDVHGLTSLHTAAACGFLQIVSLLVLFGGDVFCMTRELELPIDLAKDVNVVRLLSQEMTRRLHSEVYVSSYLLRKVFELWILFKRLLAWILITIVRKVIQVWNNFKMKQE
ncbi:protein phosphatase 1 regulatory subunit 12A-like [Gigantopelta aegis]|uniref:protein phosphatase 1 regulatory subunit 12A-like n=1 Tax=Gigantopelta aegis TaxID=1735272 RepID=UPI001B88A2C4|nr:protein phosphatase 1 regulatory subunit 12A-like [Gigantopelta aegis]